MIDTNFCEPLPNNLFNLGIRYLTEVATHGIIPESNDLKDKIINRLDKHKTTGYILEIRDKFCNSKSSINEKKFLYLERWLRQQGELKKRATEVVHKIIDPIIDDIKCLSLIINNSKFYAEIINVAGDVDVTKEKIQENVNSSDDPKLIEFSKQIGITKKQKQK